jgi:pimeloyl-ACP methyl ester carboxylesterase
MSAPAGFGKTTILATWHHKSGVPTAWLSLDEEDNDPRDDLTAVSAPVLAFFREDDLLQPPERSAALYEQYLTEAGNQNFKIVLIPGTGHEISPFNPVYQEGLSSWLDQLLSQ